MQCKTSFHVVETSFISELKAISECGSPNVHGFSITIFLLSLFELKILHTFLTHGCFKRLNGTIDFEFGS